VPIDKFKIQTGIVETLQLTPEIKFMSINFLGGNLRSPSYLLTPWSRVLPEKLKRPELLKKFPTFYGTRRFITVFTRASHLSLP
jgi:hypothetical protein